MCSELTRVRVALQKVERAKATTGKSTTKEEDDEPVGEKPQAVLTELESGLYAEWLDGAGCYKTDLCNQFIQTYCNLYQKNVWIDLILLF